MTILDELSLDQILNLYKEKQTLIEEANLEKLLQFKQKYPSLFEEKIEREVFELKEQINILMNSDYFKDLQKKEQKKKLLVVNFDEWRPGMLNTFLQEIPTIYFSDIYLVARELIKDTIACSIEQFKEHNITSCSIAEVFPLLGFLISDLIKHNAERHHIRARRIAIEKLKLEYDVSQLQNNDEGDTYADWRIRINNYEEIKENIKIIYNNLIQDSREKFDKREGFTDDLSLFCVIEAAEFIELLANSARMYQDTKKDVLDRVLQNF